MIGQETHTPSGALLTELVLEVFRLNGRLLAAGDALVGPLGLSSARWQVLGSVALAPTPEPVPHLARRLGLARQSVQRLVNELVAEGYLGLAPNPHHKRAKLVLMTPKGEAATQAAAALQTPWANALAEGVGPAGIEAALGVLQAVRGRLEGMAPAGDRVQSLAGRGG